MKEKSKYKMEEEEENSNGEKLTLFFPPIQTLRRLPRQCRAPPLRKRETPKRRKRKKRT